MPFRRSPCPWLEPLGDKAEGLLGTACFDYRAKIGLV